MKIYDSQQAYDNAMEPEIESNESPDYEETLTEDDDNTDTTNSPN